MDPGLKPAEGLQSVLHTMTSCSLDHSFPVPGTPGIREPPPHGLSKSLLSTSSYKIRLKIKCLPTLGFKSSRALSFIMKNSQCAKCTEIAFLKMGLHLGLSLTKTEISSNTLFSEPQSLVHSSLDNIATSYWAFYAYCHCSTPDLSRKTSKSLPRHPNPSTCF